MVGIRRGTEISGGAGSPSGGGGERLPWLEPVEDEDEDGHGAGYGAEREAPGGYGGVVLAALVVLAGIAIVTAGVVWFRHHRAATADIGEVIHAEPGPYKVKPANPGGLEADEVGSVAAATSAGGDIDSVLDLSAVPEAPVARAKAGGKGTAAPAPAAPAPAPVAAAPAPVAAKAPPPKPAVANPAPIEVADAAPGGGGGAIQLGAFSSEAKAKAAWKSLAARFAFLKEMTPVVSAVESGEGKLFRLRASGSSEPAARLCAQLRVAGESCAVVGG